MVYLLAIFVYLFLLTGIGIYKSRQVKTEDDFAVAGRSLSPWIMVCTMLAVWIGTGSIVGNAEETYNSGMAAMIIPFGTLLGMIMLSMIAMRARNIEATTVPEIIGNRFGNRARMLAVVALIIAYMVIVSYQFNAGGAVLEVIAGDKEPVLLQAGDTVTARQLKKGRIVYRPAEDWTGTTSVSFAPPEMPEKAFDYSIRVEPRKIIVDTVEKTKDIENIAAIKTNTICRIRFIPVERAKEMVVQSLPENGQLSLVEPKLTAQTATIIAAIFIIIYTMLAGLLSLAYADIVTGIIITASVVIAFPVLLIKAGGFSGMSESFAMMADKTQHMEFWGVYKPVDYINYLLPIFLLVMGDANQYQRIFASKNAKGARKAVLIMIFMAFIIEMLIIANAWVSASMTPDPENGKYILIYSAKNLMPGVLGIVFLVTVVGIIVSTADSFLLVPSVTFTKDIYLKHINPNANEKKVILFNRMLVLLFGIIAYLVTMAFAETTGFFKKALYAYTVYGSAITPSLIAAMFWKRATKIGAISSILSGTAVTLLWGAVIQKYVSGWLLDLDAALPAILVSVIVLITVSLLTGKKKA